MVEQLCPDGEAEARGRWRKVAKAIVASSALARVQPSIRRPTDVISAVVEPAVLMSFVSSVI